MTKRILSLTTALLFTAAAAWAEDEEAVEPLIRVNVAVSEAREKEILAQAARWTVARDNSIAMVSTFTANLAADPVFAPAVPEVKEHFDEVFAVLFKEEFAQAARLRALKVSLGMLKTRGKITEQERAERFTALQKYFNLRLFFAYGNQVPTNVDDAMKDEDDKPLGRKYAGPGWKIAITEKEFNKLSVKYIQASGFDNDTIMNPTEAI